MPYNKKSVEEGKEATRKVLKILDDHLRTRTYFVGETVTAADIMITDVAQSGCSFVFDAPLRAEFPNLFRCVALAALLRCTSDLHMPVADCHYKTFVDTTTPSPTRPSTFPAHPTATALSTARRPSVSLLFDGASPSLLINGSLTLFCDLSQSSSPLPSHKAL